MVLLTNAVREGRAHQVKLLLKAGVNVNLADKDGQTALIHCCFVEDPKVRMIILKLLVNYECNVTVRDKYGRGVVSWACALARVDVLSYLLNDTNLELDFNNVDNDGSTTLLLAVMSGCLEMVQMVLMMVLKTSTIGQIHRSNNAGMCPLLAAFCRGDKKCARLLIKDGGSPLSSVIKYIQEQDEFYPPKSHPFYDFIAKSRDLESGLDNRGVLSERDILQFLFAKDDRSPRANKTSLSLKTKSNTMIDFCSTKSTAGLMTRNSNDLPDINTDNSSEIDMTSQSLHANLRISVSRYYSSQESVPQLYGLYTHQLTPSYREGLPLRRYRTPSPPPPPRKESRSHRNSVQYEMKASKRGSISSSSGSYPLESAFDRQMRQKYARTNRAASMHVAKLPPIPVHLKKIKRTKSSTSLKVTTNLT